MRQNAGGNTALQPDKSQIIPQTKSAFSWGPQGQVHCPWPPESLAVSRQEPARGRSDAARGGNARVLFAVRPCSPLSSRPDFSQRSIYNSADLLKVISEPSGPARWPEEGGPPQRAARLENLNGHSATAKTHKLKTNRKHCLHY